ncbi:MAG: shikimate kinase [Lachnospiraceae bacterium]|nr:shikimate kinase [Lachnospiraceae bacterium]
MNITLIGMPAAGKSVIGVLLAKKLGYDFVDSDLLIQKQEGSLLHEIIHDKGVAKFKEIEEQVNASLDVHNTVIAPGGSVIYGEKAMKHLSEISFVVYLKVPYAELEQRLGDLEHRGVVLEGGMTLYDLYEERVPYYEKYSMMEIDETGKTAAEVVKEIISQLEKMRGIL